MDAFLEVVPAAPVSCWYATPLKKNCVPFGKKNLEPCVSRLA